MSDLTEKDKHLWDQRAKIILDDVSYSASIISAKIKWLLSLGFILNGGALLTLARTDQQILLLIDGPGWLYLAGIVCGITSSVLAVISFARSAENELESLWRGDHLNAKEFSDFIDNSQSSLINYRELLFSVLGMILFVSGTFWFGYLVYNSTQ